MAAAGDKLPQATSGLVRAARKLELHIKTGAALSLKKVAVANSEPPAVEVGTSAAEPPASEETQDVEECRRGPDEGLTAGSSQLPPPPKPLQTDWPPSKMNRAEY
jgi:hypothetical protein